MSERFAEDHPVMDAAWVSQVVQRHECPELEALLHAAAAIESDAEDLYWTRTDPVEVPGLRRAAMLTRMLAATHVETAHGPDAVCPSARMSGGPLPGC